MEKLCTHWGQQDLTQLQKQTRVDICHQLLAPHNQDIKGFFTRLVTGDKPSLHYHTPNMRRLSLQLGSPWHEKFQMAPSVEKCMVTILWDKTCESLTSLGFTVLPHPTYSVNLAPSDYDLFDIRCAQRNERYPTKEALRKLTMTGIAAWWRIGSVKPSGSSQWWQRFIDLGKEYVELEVVCSSG